MLKFGIVLMKKTKDLIDADKILLRKILEVPIPTPIHFLYLENVEIPMGNILQSH
jgi:hypothetical protein